ncbi:MAG: class I SAM-dependent RNA methyltransferase [Clostridia bacterium]|nr:class I SAM-dependent RNA methyltransferase [Clostridia bacterium]
MKKNDLFESGITDVTNLGAGVAKIDEPPYTVFVQGGVTGDLALLRCIKLAKNYAVARIERLIKPSPYRTDPVCPVWRRCGGCSFAHISHEYELEVKRRSIINFLRKEGFSEEEPTVHPVYTNGVVYGYRNKVQYPVSGGRVGFYANRTHDIIENDGCALQYPVFDDILFHIKSLGIPDGVRHICMRAGGGSPPPDCDLKGSQAGRSAPVDGGKAVMLIFVVYRAGTVGKKYIEKIISEFPEITTVAENINPDETNVIFGNKTNILCGDGYIEDTMCGLTFRISPTSFYQVNSRTAEKLYEKAAELAALEDGEKLLDLFCGTGTIGLSMIKDKPGCELTGVEIVPGAVANAVDNAKINNIGNAAFVCTDAGSACPRNSDENSNDLLCIGTGISKNDDLLKPSARINDIDYDCIVVDPPRKGLGAELCEKLSKSTAKRIIYISCGPDTLARDLRYFKDAGWEIGDLYPFDMFPRTGHVETVVRLSRQ